MRGWNRADRCQRQTGLARIPSVCTIIVACSRVQGWAKEEYPSRHGAVDQCSQRKKFPSVKWKAKRGTTGNKRGYWESGMAEEAEEKHRGLVRLGTRHYYTFTVHLVVSSSVCCTILLLPSPPRYTRIFIKTNAPSNPSQCSLVVDGIWTLWNQCRKLDICIYIYLKFIYFFFSRKWISKDGLLDGRGKLFWIGLILKNLYENMIKVLKII